MNAQTSSPPGMRTILKKMLPFGKRFSGRILISLALTVIAGLIQLALPLGVKQLFDEAVKHHDASSINTIAIALAAIFLVRALTGYFGQYILQLTGDRITNDLRVHLLQHYQDLPLVYHHNHRIGDLISRIYSDAPEIRNVITNLSVTGTLNVALLLGSSVVMLQMNWRLGLIVLALGPATTIVSRLFGPHFRKVSVDIKSSISNAMAFAQESVAGSHVVRIFDAKGRNVPHFKDLMEESFRQTSKGRNLDAAYSAIITFLTVISTIVLFWFGGHEVVAERMSIGALVAFFMYSQSVNQSISALAQQYSTINQSIGASSRVFELLDQSTEDMANDDNIEFSDSNATIEFQNVGFRYHDSIPVLENINFKVSSGKMLAILGPSGIGKSSLLDLIPRFYNPQSGTILLNGVNIENYSLVSLRTAISLVSQDVFLFSATIRENIRYGNPQATNEEVEQAAREANAHQFILAQKAGYDTQVGERGVQLSGGQRQRIAIARALLRNAPILILDEATSAVDSETDVLIHEALEKLRYNRTTLVVAHRSSTVEKADIVLQLGPLESEK